MAPIAEVVPPAVPYRVVEEREAPVTAFGSLGVLFCFVLVWISSVTAPPVGVVLALLGYRVVPTILAVVAAVAYLPGVRRVPYLADSCHRMIETGVPRFAMVFEAGAEPKDPATAAPTAPPTFYAVHPHGIFSLGWAALFTWRAMRTVTFCFSDGLYASPYFRLLSKLTGKPAGASKASLQSLLRKGRDVALLPGGFEEATISKLGVDRAYAKKRAGFLKYCLQVGARVCPVYAFGECHFYHNAQGLWRLRFWLNGHGLPAVAFWGRAAMPCAPKTSAPSGLVIVVGRPVELPRIANPTPDDVRAAHAKYIEALTGLFERHKGLAYAVGPYGKPANGGNGASNARTLELW
mmetsp:Transcript_21627/g.85957  ORF Transcript_21627/g.85957 Transcript_21627/m.85957 type:complete len:350 (+) Transcript_21627:60-1109(+)